MTSSMCLQTFFDTGKAFQGICINGGTKTAECPSRHDQVFNWVRSIRCLPAPQNHEAHAQSHSDRVRSGRPIGFATIYLSRSIMRLGL
jgi:hypothetical protein